MAESMHESVGNSTSILHLRIDLECCQELAVCIGAAVKDECTITDLFAQEV